ncbi:hypothetical protein D9758_018468 [Tetrapyrgos nigripes]|uniref:DUF659 domain-containing protein n=1 Tax=Tetrapyrgos nigripes TaxID=182062 RepID=A0A8H5EZ40_9AGAR|nr:hypothetical protein D9758_018468 [Tetrapyrgos nigripes]
MTDDTHTAQWIRGLVKAVSWHFQIWLILQWIEKIGSEHFCTACSDSTGSTLLARQLLHQDFPHILSVADICHHLNNTSKDIVKLKFFDVPIKIIRSSIKTFSKSHPAKSALKAARRQKQTGPGLEAIGKTHFVTLTLSAISVRRTLPALQQVFSTPQKFDFVVEQTITDTDYGYPQEVQDDILNILNQRTAQLFTPGYLSLDLLKDNNVNPLIPTDSTTITRLEEIGIRHPRLYCFIFKYLAELASNEARYGRQKEFTMWQGRAQDLFTQFSNELKAYSWGRYPFDNPFPRDAPMEETIIWWRNSLTNDGTSVILPHLAIKLYAIRINSMADERTGSTFTAFTPANCNCMSIETMGGKTMVYQFNHQEERIRCDALSNTVGPVKVKKFRDVKHKVYGGKASDKGTEDVEKVDGSEKAPIDEDDTWLSDDEEPEGNNEEETSSAAAKNTSSVGI